MQIGAMNNPTLPVEAEVDRIGRAGFAFVDLTMEGPAATSFDAKAVKGLLETHNLGIVGHTDPVLPWAYPLEGVRRACFDELCRCADIFAELGAKIMNIHPCYQAPPAAREKIVEYNAAAIVPIAEAAAQRGLALALENFLPPFASVNTFGRLFEAAPALKLHLDIGHCNLGGDSADAFCKAFGKRLVHVHCSDNRGRADDHMPLGAGSIDWRQIAATLLQASYNSTVTLEIFCADAEMGAIYLEHNKRYFARIWDEAKG
ncbi:MAG: sugar phosphate isomerase/epimerase family protein [Desulfatibacillaceae bacterium]|nr:sugar phosphate isomerase/epimerase family protein [Desulfatibacillaceae bacterium]